VGGSLTELLQNKQLRPTQPELPFGVAGRKADRAKDAAQRID
jgi:hypothetical protein